MHELHHQHGFLSEVYYIQVKGKMKCKDGSTAILFYLTFILPVENQLSFPMMTWPEAATAWKALIENDPGSIVCSLFTASMCANLLLFILYEKSHCNGLVTALTAFASE